MAYWTSGPGRVHSFQNPSEGKRLFSENDYSLLQQIDFSKFTLSKDKGVFSFKKENFPVDQAAAKKFIEMFFNLKVVRVLDQKNDSLDFSKSLKFVFNEIKLTLQIGSPSPYSENFYMRWSIGEDQKTLLVEDQNNIERLVVKNSEQVSKDKYLRFKTLFNLPSSVFQNTEVFRGVSSLNLIRISTQSIPPISLNPSVMDTIPSPPKGISVDSDKLKKWKESLLKIRSQKLMASLESAQEHSSLELQTNHQIHNYKIFTQNSSYFLKREGQSFFHQLKPDQGKLLLPSVQDFWILSLRIPKVVPSDLLVLSKNKKTPVTQTQEFEKIWKFLQKRADYFVKDFPELKAESSALSIYWGKRQIDLYSMGNEVWALDSQHSGAFVFKGEQVESLNLKAEVYVGH